MGFQGYLQVLTDISQGPHSHILMTGGEGGGGSSDFFGSEILAQRDFLGLCKTTEFFWVAKRKQGFFGVAKKELRDFFVYANKSSDFLGRQIS